MAYKTYSSGLTIKSPTEGSKGYAKTMETDTYQKISEHDHTGGGKGTKIGSSAIATSAVKSTNIDINANVSASADFGIFHNTIDGSDNRSSTFGGGGAAATDGSRGAYFEAFGNDHASSAGKARLYSGNATGSIIALLAKASDGEIIFHTVSADRWKVEADGDFAQSAGGGNLVFSIAGKGVRDTVETVSGAGTVQADALQSTKTIVNITGGANNSGVKVLATIPIGGMQIFYNANASNTINLYPAVGHSIFKGLVDTAVPLTPGLTVALFGVSSTDWALIG